MANYNAIEPNTVLGFKSGVQTDLNKYLIGGEKAGQAVEGVFYLTTDTHRLYIGRKSDDSNVYPVPVNQGILSVNNIDDLKTISGNQGEFYYVETANILCIRSGDKWVQINPDTDTKVEDFEIQISSEADSNSAKILHTIETNDDGIDPFEAEFSIIGGSNITVTADSDNKSITISTSDNNNTTIDSITVTSFKGSTAPEASDEDKKTGYEIAITDSDDNTLNDTLDPEIKYGKDKTSSAKFRDNILNLDVYTTEEVDSLFKAADALVFRGVINDYSELPEVEVQNGDTYKIGVEFTHDSAVYKVGDILIAHGDAENEDGHLTTIQWVHIPAGDEVYTGGAVINIGTDGTINHNTIATNETKGEAIKSFTFNVIDSISADNYGHITDYTIREVTVPQLVWEAF